MLPNRADVSMTTPFMDAYVRLLIKTCHARGCHAMGGMAAQIPIKNDAAANDAALAKVCALCGLCGCLFKRAVVLRVLCVFCVVGVRSCRC